MTSLRSLCILIVCLTCAACSRQADIVSGGSLSGTVTAGDAALGGVVVTADGKSATTDSRGCYMLEELKAGACAVTFSLEGYAEVSRSIHILPGRNMSLDVAMVPTGEPAPPDEPPAPVEPPKPVDPDVPGTDPVDPEVPDLPESPQMPEGGELLPDFTGTRLALDRAYIDRAEWSMAFVLEAKGDGLLLHVTSDGGAPSQLAGIADGRLYYIMSRDAVHYSVGAPESAFSHEALADGRSRHIVLTSAYVKPAVITRLYIDGRFVSEIYESLDEKASPHFGRGLNMILGGECAVNGLLTVRQAEGLAMRRVRVFGRVLTDIEAASVCVLDR